MEGLFRAIFDRPVLFSEPWPERKLIEIRRKIGDFVSTARLFTPHPELGKHKERSSKMGVSSKWYYFRRFERKIHPCNCGEWLTDAILLESFPMLSNTVYFFWWRRSEKCALSGKNKTRRGFGGSEFCDFRLRAFPSGLQLFPNGMGVNYIKLQNIRLGKKWPLTL